MGMDTDGHSATRQVRSALKELLLARYHVIQCVQTINALHVAERVVDEPEEEHGESVHLTVELRNRIFHRLGRLGRRLPAPLASQLAFCGTGEAGEA